jgi:hypothetical protein
MPTPVPKKPIVIPDLAKVESLYNSPEDRVWTSITRKVNLGNYNMLEFQCGTTSSLLPEETVQEALSRIIGEVKEEYNRQLELLKSEC